MHRTSRGIRILGIDPGTQVLGWGLLIVDRGRPRLLDCGAVRGPRGASVPERLHAIHAGLAEVIIGQRPHVLAVEQAFGGKSVQSAIRLGEGRGVVLLAGAQAGLPIAEYTPARVKKSVTGLGAADKDQVAHMVARVLGLEDPPRPADAADAVAVALCHSRRLALPV